ncbi:MAG: thioredoxin family protein [Sphingobacteriales bacterium]|nr:MAG: thioredoxin family protein [Sphingobacteriales bacterium]
MNLFEQAGTVYDYEEYGGLMEELVAAGKTTGPDQSPALIHYTSLNLHRMLRWEKTFELPEAVAALAKKVPVQTWWVITEPWCGDSSQILTILHKIAAASEMNIYLRIVLRDENPGIMDKYLTHGSRSIPKLVAIDQLGNELFTWGPRPQKVQQIVDQWKADPDGVGYEELKTKVHLWYGKNKGVDIVDELAAMMKQSL